VCESIRPTASAARTGSFSLAEAQTQSFNASRSGPLLESAVSRCDTLSPMRRAHAILVIITLLAAPLALLARAASVGMPECNRMCCLQHGSHSPHLHHPVKKSAAPGAFCANHAASQGCRCVMKAAHDQVDYGFLAPIVPAAPSAIASVVIPVASRRICSPHSELPAAGFISAPFDPPRA